MEIVGNLTRHVTTLEGHTLFGEGLLAQGFSLMASRPEQAHDLLTKAERELSGEPAEWAAVYGARCYEFLGQFDEGLIVIRDVLKRVKFPGPKAYGQYVRAIFTRNHRSALKILEAIKIDQANVSLQARVHNQIAVNCRQLKRHDRALVEYAGAAALFEEAGDLKGSAHAHNNRAGVLTELAQYAAAHESADKAISLIEKGDPFLADFYDQKAQILNAQGEYSNATYYSGLALKLLDGSSRYRTIAGCLVTRSRGLGGIGSYIEAINDLVKVEDIGLRLGDESLLFEAWNNIWELSEELVKYAHTKAVEKSLSVSNNNLKRAAKLMKVSRQAVRQFMKTNKLPYTSNNTGRPVKNLT